MYTGARPGLTPAIRAGKGWRGRRELAPRCSATQLGACFVVVYRQRSSIYTQVRTTTTTTTTTTTQAFDSNTRFLVRVTVMFRNQADGLRADRAPGTVGAARRRRDRRLRAFLKHERMSVAMNMATVQHHSYMKSAVVDFCVQVGSPLAPVTEYVAPAPAVALSVPSQQLRPATVATGVNLDVTGLVHPQFSSTAVEGFASQVVGSLPLFAAPVFHRVHQEQLAGGDTTENMVNFPVVQEQGVVGSLPPAEEFTEPVFTAFHQEQFSAGETTENIANFLVVQEQVLVQAFPRLVGSSPVDEFTAYVARRPLPLVEVQPSVRAQRHIVEDLGELAPLEQILDLPVPWTS